MSLLANELEIPLLAAPGKYCGDNASMIAFAVAIDPHHARTAPEDIFPTLPLGEFSLPSGPFPGSRRKTLNWDMDR
jgi:tRNA A37 threonylcarbamoyltransferase TsaD